MVTPHGIPLWYECCARDADAADAFYRQVVGWTIAPSGMSEMDYRLLTAPDGAQVGGLMQIPAGAPMPAGWLCYVAVDDVDAAVAQVQAAGGAVHMPAMTMEGVGRMALVADPDGAAFYVMRSMSVGESTSFQHAPEAVPGHVVWNELLAPDQEAAMRFYAGLFGWRHDGSMPMGEAGDYRFVHAGQTPIGATMQTPEGEAAGWRFYILVDDIDAAMTRIGAAGGTIRRGPDPIPGGAFSLLAADPAGATFGLVGQRNG